MIVLRQDQRGLLDGVRNYWRAGQRNVIAVLPTGGGKSVIMSQDILDDDQAGIAQAVIAHRTELVGQMSLHVARRGVMHRIIAPKQVISDITAEHRREFNGRSFITPSARCTVAGVDTLIAREDELQAWALQIGKWRIDEAHHVLRTNKWGKAVAMFPNALGLGVTATPQRADGMGLGAHADGVFHAMVVGPSMRELIEMGALCDYEIVVPESDFQIDESDIAPSGDWSPKKMREASKRSHIVGDVVAEYCKYAFGKRGIVFATDVETAGEMAANFKAVGIPAEAVSAKTPAHTRSEYIRRFRDGRLWVLVNVDLFGEGFDVPAVEIVSMARPTASLAVYLQQFGRALRTLEGKPIGLVIDHVSNWKRHGLPDKQRLWTLDRKQKRAKSEPDPEEIELRACGGCSRPYERALLACPRCGWEPEPPVGGARSIEQVDGDLRLLTREALAEMRKAALLPSPASMGIKVGMAAGEIAGKAAVNRSIERHAAQQRLSDAIALWAGHQRAKGRPDGESYRRFYLAAGIDVLSALALPRDEMDKLATIVEGWCK
jgi:DNA repair protein RadD